MAVHGGFVPGTGAHSSFQAMTGHAPHGSHDHDDDSHGAHDHPDLDEIVDDHADHLNAHAARLDALEDQVAGHTVHSGTEPDAGGHRGTDDQDDR